MTVVHRSTAMTAADPFATLPEPTPGQRLRRRLLGQRSFMIGTSILVTIVLIALFAPWLAPHDPYENNLANRMAPPFWHENAQPEHPLGTDGVGRDYLSRLIYGARVSLLIGIVPVLIAGTIGTTLGIAAGYFGGRVDLVVSFMINTRLSLPLFLVALAVVALYGASLQIVILVLGLFLWDQFAVVMRSVARQIRTAGYVRAAQAAGCSTPRILFREILPNTRGPLLVVATIEMANAILLEASLSFLGFGVQAPTPSWGLMISTAREFMFFSPWLIAIPGAALFVLVLAINLTGDALRDVEQTFIGRAG